ncbi:hypothetical protein [Cellulomonas sp. PhB143]|uniref:hypothetical protein n=1 Tax=Cellulomonas sp. PhB143 TaxID=2485186 RepID=UPI000F48119B|nr:hypothetical protein [Cellulomonas sp. PhB143]ROS79074.1 hypothetical protein EDF32_0120 [Cellulomonas sp. PhB143]
MNPPGACPALDRDSPAALLDDARWRVDACLATLAGADRLPWAGHAAGAYRDALAEVRARAAEAARLVEAAVASARGFESFAAADPW